MIPMMIIDPLTDILPFYIQFYDENFTVLDMNQASVRVFRLKNKEEGIGRSLNDLNPGFYQTERPAIYRKVFETGQPVTLNAVTLNLDPPTHYGVYVFLYKPGIICLCSFDVTMWVEEQMQRIRELESKNSQLEQFAYVASHDLQEPLRTLTSFVDLLEEDKTSTLSSEGKEFIKFIRSATGRMQTLIRDLLEYSRAGKWNPRMVSADDVLKDVLEDLDAEIVRTQAVVTCEPLPEIYFDPTQLKQLFLNLLTNSLKFRSPDRQPTIHVGVVAVPKGFEFQIKDNGIGIDPQYHDRIFRLFQRLHSRTKYEGSGIGLALCKRILDGAGGSIRLSSVLGEGSTFAFTVLARR
jgi:signal transduction histidine kinase